MLLSATFHHHIFVLLSFCLYKTNFCRTKLCIAKIAMFTADKKMGRFAHCFLLCSITEVFVVLFLYLMFLQRSPQMWNRRNPHLGSLSDSFLPGTLVHRAVRTFIPAILMVFTAEEKNSPDLEIFPPTIIRRSSYFRNKFKMRQKTVNVTRDTEKNIVLLCCLLYFLVQKEDLCN